MRLILILFALTFFACHDNGVDPDNHATAKIDGVDWIAQVAASHTTRFGESGVNIIISNPNLIKPEETIGFLHVPLKTGEYIVKESITTFDSTGVLGYYKPDVRIIPFISYLPIENEINILVIESYNEITGDIIFSFENTFENPPIVATNRVEIREGKGVVMLH